MILRVFYVTFMEAVSKRSNTFSFLHFMLQYFSAQFSYTHEYLKKRKIIIAKTSANILFKYKNLELLNGAENSVYNNKFCMHSCPITCDTYVTPTWN